MKNKIRTCLVGLGYAGVSRYIPIMRGMKEFDLAGVIDSDGEKAKKVAGEFGIKNYSSSDNLNSAGWIDGLEAVVIATPPFSHYRYIKEFLEKGKHILTDKPFVMSLAEADEVIALAKKNNLKLAIIHNSQFSDSFNNLMADIEKGKLGRIKAVFCSLLNNPKREVPRWHHDLPWGQFYDESPHSFYMLVRLFSDGLKYAGSYSYPNSDKSKKTPSAVFVNYTGQDESGFDIPVEADFNFEAPLSEWHLKVIGEKGVGLADYFRDIYIFLPNDGAHKLKDVLKTSFLLTRQHWANQAKPAFKYLFGTWLAGHDEVFRIFSEALITGGQLGFIDGSFALKVLKMQHEVMTRGREL